MRPLLILLLLLCTLLAAADANLNCDRSLIKGVDPSKIHFEDATKTLTCVAGENALMAIEFDSNRYAALSCDESEGWKTKKLKMLKWTTEEYKVAEASIILNIACVEYCVATGVGIKVEKSDDIEKNDRIEITCEYDYKYLGKDSTEQLYYGHTQIKDATCTLADWELKLNNDEIVRGIDSGRPAKFECRLEPPPVTQRKENNEHSEVTSVTLPSTTRKPVEKDSRPKCDLSLIKGVDPSKIYFDDATNTLTCVSKANSLMAIKFNEERYVSLTCNQIDGWKANFIRNDKEIVANIQSASIPLNIACVEYCAATGVGIKVDKRIKHFESDDYVEISCADPYPVELFYGQSHLVDVGCSLERGWTWKHGHKDNSTWTMFEKNPKQFECKKDPRPKCDLSLINGVDSSQIHFDVATDLDVYQWKTLTCISGENSLRAIEFNSKRFASLTCNEYEGWQANKEIDGDWGFYTIAEATAPLEIACVEFCAATGVGIKIEKNNFFEKNGLIEVSCALNFIYQMNYVYQTLFYHQKHVAFAFCSLDGPFEWKLFLDLDDRMKNKPVYRNDFGKPAEFECRLVLPTPIATTTERTERTTITTTLKKTDEPTTAIPNTTTTTLPSITRTPKVEVSIAEAQSGAQIPIIIGCSIGGFIVGVIVVFVIFKLFLTNKKRPEGGHSEQSVKATEEGRKKNKKRAGNESLSDLSSGR